MSSSAPTTLPNLTATTTRPPAAGRWPLERVLFALAGSVTLLSAALAAAVSPWFLLLTGFVGVNQWLFVLTGNCPASLILRRTCHVRSAFDATQEVSH